MNGEQVLKELYSINSKLRKLHLEISDENFDSSSLNWETIDKIGYSFEQTIEVATKTYKIAVEKYK